MSPEKSWHARAVFKFFAALDQIAPPHYVVEHEKAVRRSSRSAPEPDLSIVHASAFHPHNGIYAPEEVVLAAEVISPEPEERDREDKPIIYGAMGIPTFWLVECGKDDVPIVHEHRLIGGAYRLMKTHIERLVPDVPFPIDIPLVNPTLR
jgi:Uma2 family endonuclease